MQLHGQPGSQPVENSIPVPGLAEAFPNPLSLTSTFLLVELSFVDSTALNPTDLMSLGSQS